MMLSNRSKNKKQYINPESGTDQGKVLKFAYNQWWVVANNQIARQATEHEIKRWMVVRLLKELPAV